MHEPEWFRLLLILIFQSVDCTNIVQNKDDMTICIRQYRKQQMDRSYKIIKICLHLVWSFSHLSQLLINCLSSSRHLYLLSWHLPPKIIKSNLCTWKTKHNFRKLLLQKNSVEEVAITKCSICRNVYELKFSPEAGSVSGMCQSSLLDVTRENKQEQELNTFGNKNGSHNHPLSFL